MEFTKEDRNLCMRAAKMYRAEANRLLEPNTVVLDAKGIKANKRHHEKLLAENERLKALGRRIQKYADAETPPAANVVDVTRALG